MRRGLLLTIGVLLLLLVAVSPAGPVGAQSDLPPYPWTVYGQVLINGVAAGANTQVEARNPVGFAECGQTSSLSGGNFAVDVEAAGQTAGCFSNGNTVQFRVRVSGVYLVARQLPSGGTFQSGEVQSINLSAVTCQGIAPRWRQQAGDPGWNSVFDMDGDQRITIKDIASVAAQGGCL